MGAPSEAQRMAAVRQIYTQLLERMIDDRLIIQAADEEDVHVTSAEVQTAIDNVRRQSGLGEEEFWQAVRGQGFTQDSYRRDVRHQLLRLKVLNTRVRGRVNITEEDVRRRYDEAAVRARRQSTFEACYVRLALDPDAGAAETHRAMEAAQSIRDAIDSLSDFELAMDEHGGSCTGRIQEGDIDPQLGEALAQLEQGETSDPVRTESGIFLLHVLERELASADLPAYDEVRMDLYREMMQEEMTRQEELFLAELRRRAVIDRRLEL
jgi:peptidyl-prolyl cis-trans isomerase SurA